MTKITKEEVDLFLQVSSFWKTINTQLGLSPYASPEETMAEIERREEKIRRLRSELGRLEHINKG